MSLSLDKLSNGVVPCVTMDGRGIYLDQELFNVIKCLGALLNDACSCVCKADVRSALRFVSRLSSFELSEQDMHSVGWHMYDALECDV